MSALRALRLWSAAEGASLLLLLVVAMPLKYVWGEPLAVRIAGAVHGLAVLALLSALLRAQLERTLPARTLLYVLGLALVPFGFLAVDRRLRTAR